MGSEHFCVAVPVCVTRLSSALYTDWQPHSNKLQKCRCKTPSLIVQCSGKGRRLGALVCPFGSLLDDVLALFGNSLYQVAGRQWIVCMLHR